MNIVSWLNEGLERKYFIEKRAADRNEAVITTGHKDPDLVFENDRCKVWVPYTYETFSGLCRGTYWCLGDSARQGWDNYSKDGPFFIMIMKDNPEEKYQFFFERTPWHTPVFMDKNDNRINLDNFPEMKERWVEDTRKKYKKMQDEPLAKQIDSILGQGSIATQNKLDEICDMIGGMHDRSLASKYIEQLNGRVLDAFYANLTPELTEDSPSCGYLRKYPGKVNLVLPNSVKILGNKCFSECASLQSIVIPNSITSLGVSCFENCSNLEKITLPDSITSLSDLCFCGCSFLPEITLPKSITSLGDDCFEDCSSLREINIPDGVASLGDWCFAYCSGLQKINLPSSVTSIRSNCFMECPIEDVYYSGSEEDRRHLRIQPGNEDLLKAKWHYNYKG